MDLFSSISALVQGNQMLQAAIVAGPATALAWSVKTVPMSIYKGIKHCVSVEVRFNSDSPDYEAVQRFVAERIIKDFFTRSYNYQATERWDGEMCEHAIEDRALTAGYGNHIGWYRGTLVTVGRFMEDGATTEKFKEFLEVHFFTRSKKVIKQFFADVSAAAGKLDDFNSVPLYINAGGWWRKANRLPLRSMDTIFTTDDIGNDILAALREFEGKRAYNHERGLPHHMGVLLKGPPGTGKSSLIHALASEMKRSIFYLSLASVQNDEKLIELICSPRDWSKVLLVLEDFDAAGVNTNRPVASDDADDDGCTVGPGGPVKPISLSTMLNLLDGLLSPDGLVTIATTNHPENIDPALLRSGRFDISVELGPLGIVEFRRMADLFDADPESFEVPEDLTMTGSDMRALILNPELARAA